MFDNGYNGYYGCGISPYRCGGNNNYYPQRDECCQRAFERGFRLGLSYADNDNDCGCGFHQSCCCN